MKRPFNEDGCCHTTRASDLPCKDKVARVLCQWSSNCRRDVSNSGFSSVSLKRSLEKKIPVLLHETLRCTQLEHTLTKHTKKTGTRVFFFAFRKRSRTKEKPLPISLAQKREHRTQKTNRKRKLPVFLLQGGWATIRISKNENKSGGKKRMRLTASVCLQTLSRSVVLSRTV